MAKYKFYASTGYVGAEREDIVELPDDYTEEDIQEEFDAWLGNNVELTWYKMEGKED
ncbi:MAG: hypothetical protein K0Q53_119 [Massilibacillus sp.]|jgi:hypothetical protein|nr:hypothetical protein [Massilibacillus sp.]